MISSCDQPPHRFDRNLFDRNLKEYNTLCARLSLCFRRLSQIGTTSTVNEASGNFQLRPGRRWFIRVSEGVLRLHAVSLKCDLQRKMAGFLQRYLTLCCSNDEGAAGRFDNIIRDDRQAVDFEDAFDLHKQA